MVVRRRCTKQRIQRLQEHALVLVCRLRSGCKRQSRKIALRARIEVGETVSIDRLQIMKKAQAVARTMYVYTYIH